MTSQNATPAIQAGDRALSIIMTIVLIVGLSGIAVQTAASNGEEGQSR
jgi:hypothetical protein